MENIFYLLNMRVSGIKNIKKEIRLDFYKKTVDKSFDAEHYRIKAIYGENGSGKSAIVTAVRIFQDFFLGANYLNETGTQIFLDETINKSTQKMILSFEFLTVTGADMYVYDYSLQIGKQENGMYEIQREVFRVKNGSYPNRKYRTIFESKNGELIQLHCREGEKENLERISMNLLSTHSFFYLYSKYLNEEKAKIKIREKDIDLLIHISSGILFAMTIRVYLEEEDQHELFFLRKRFLENSTDYQALRKEFLSIRKDVDISLNVNTRMIDQKRYPAYKARVERLAQFLKIFKPELVSIDIDKKEKGDQYECDLNLNYGEYCINKEFESTGIKKLIRLFDCFMAASTVGIVFVDEMDSNLNDVYLCKLIEYFMYYGKGQLCFTTHNLDPMTILKENRNSIDFLSSDNTLVSWTSRGNASPENCYKNGMIEDSPFNIDATDFVGILGE